MKQNENSLKKEATLLTASKMVNLAITMATAMLLARFRSLEEYGTYSQLTLTLNLLTTLCLLGIPNAINYFLPRTENAGERQNFLNTFFTLNTALALIAGFVMLASLPFQVWYFENDGIYSFWFFAVIMPWAKISLQERGNLLVASHKSKTLIVHTFINSICLLGIIILTRVINQSFFFYMCLYVAVEILFGLLVYWEGAKLSGRFRFHIDWELCKRILIFSVPIGLSDMVSIISKEVDKFMIGGFLDTESLAIYTNAATELPLSIISGSFVAVMMPKLSKMVKEKKDEDAVNLWKDTTAFTYIFMCFGVAALVVFAPQVMVILYSPKYLPGTGVFRVYALILLWRTAYFGTMLSLHGETKKVLYCSVSSMLINVGLNFALYMTLGFTGPAWSTFIAVGIVDLFQLKLSSKVTGVPMSKIFPWVDLLTITLVNAVSGLAIYALMRYLEIGTDIRGCVIAVFVGAIWMALYLFVIMRRRIKRQWHTS
ncbi:MAG: oligosaccharide flippase family protein [Lachnospiraceae bacterium]|nr:oligosaccharide flippase family protein [Lachnospiraceae bacterium]